MLCSALDFPHDPRGGLYVVLILAGIALIILGVVYTWMGRVYARFHGWISRVDDPKGYWSGIASYFVAGAVLIAYSLYRKWFSN